MNGAAAGAGPSAGEYLGQEEFQVAALPARVAYLIRTNSRTGYVRAVQEATTRWGGATEPIIPVRASGKVDGFWRQVVAQANVDEAVNVDVSETAAATAATALCLDLVPLRHIDQMGVGQFTCHPSATSFDPNGHVSGGFLGGSIPPLWTHAEPDLPLWAITAAGALTSEARQGATDSGDPILTTRDLLQLAIAQVAGTTGLDRTVLQLSERWASPAPWSGPALIWITEPNSLLDCLHYWNRRALRPLQYATWPMLILPQKDVD